MKKREAGLFFDAARKYVLAEHPDDIRTVRALVRRPFSKITAKQFLEEYAWVVYASGFRVAVLEAKWADLKRAFRAFDPTSVSKLSSLAPVLKTFGNRRKAESVVRGAKLIAEEGFPSFRRRVANAGTDSLAALPGIGPITKDHLARNVGLENTAKNDIWIRRLVTQFEARDHDELASALAQRTGEPVAVVDTILWRFCADHGWRQHGSASLKSFCASLT